MELTGFLRLAYGNFRLDYLGYPYLAEVYMDILVDGQSTLFGGVSSNFSSAGFGLESDHCPKKIGKTLEQMKKEAFGELSDKIEKVLAQGKKLEVGSEWLTRLALNKEADRMKAILYERNLVDEQSYCCPFRFGD